jgi:hypothetical protein
MILKLAGDINYITLLYIINKKIGKLSSLSTISCGFKQKLYPMKKN